jgi:hypothetical protein
MYFDEAEAVIRSHIETQWALSAYAVMPLVFEAETPTVSENYIAIIIDGIRGEGSKYGGTGKRFTIEDGIVYIHAFVPQGAGKAAASGPVRVLSSILELQTVGTGINMDKANPPSPVGYGNDLVDTAQPAGSFYRVSGSVPFVVISTV